MKRLFYVLAIIALMMLTFLAAPVTAQPLSYDDQPSGPPAPGSQDELEQAVFLAIQAHREGVLAFTLFDILIDRIDYSEDGTQAVVWLAFVDPENGQTLPTEPGLAIGTLMPDPESGVEHWQVTLQADMAWDASLESLPGEIMAAEDRELYRTPSEVTALAGTTYTGYFLPWKKGLTKYLSGSIGHVFTYKSCPDDCMYAFDFYDGTMFGLSAAKGGVVKYAKWNCENGDEDCSNYLVLQDNTTSPVTYQLYLHLAHESIPSGLRSAGAAVKQGDFIGKADDTGYSTGHHLHFHVHTNPYSYWGTSVDITFADVSVNGGRPRTCAEAAAYPQYGDECMPDNAYVSGNTGDEVPPVGHLDYPWGQTTISGGTLGATGTMADNLALGYGRLMVKYVGQDWKAVGSTLTGNSFDTSLNLCSAGIPNGPFQLGLQVWDAVGNTSGVVGQRTLANDSNCTPGLLCQPASDQVALFNDPDFGGSCLVYGTGTFSAIGDPLGPNNGESLLVGSQVRAILYDLGGNQGRRDVFRTRQASFSDDLLTSAGVDSIRVEELNKIPYAVNLSVPTNRLGENPTTSDSLILYLGGGQGAIEYRMELTSTNGFSQILNWQPYKDWSVGSLPAGSYTWKAFARNSGGTMSATKTFSVDEALPVGQDSISLPYLQAFEDEGSGWAADGLWRRAYISRGGHNNYGYVFNISDATQHYNDPVIRGGSLTSPPITVAETGYYLRFSQYPLTENGNRYWDQRWLQVSVDGAPFQNLLQFQDERRGVWLAAAPVDLSPFAGHTIRLRFYMHTVDGYYNEFYGWVIDDVRITQDAPPVCTEPIADDTPTSAQGIALGAEVSGSICPGDTDWYAVSLAAGQRIYADTDAATVGSPLDTYLWLVDGDGSSVLKDNNNHDGTSDSWIEYAIKRSGTYYLKVRSANYPGAGGPDSTYKLRIRLDTPPSVRWLAPVSEVVPGIQPFTAQVRATDDRGIVKAEFFYHSRNWTLPEWTPLGEDSDGSNGWSVGIDPVALGVTDGAALMTKVTDSAGNQRVSVYWNLKVDVTPPTTYLYALPAVSPTTLIQLHWQVLQGMDDLDHFELLEKVNSGTWQVIDSSIGPNIRNYERWGTAGTRYDYCLRGVDAAGNREACPNPPTVWTTIEAVCVPDAFETDNASGSGAWLTLGEVQTHNLCQADVDWIRVALDAGQTVFVHASPLEDALAVQMEVYGPGSPGALLQTLEPAGWGKGVGWYFTPSESGTYSLRLQASDSRLWGSGALYFVRVSEPVELFVPLVW